MNTNEIGVNTPLVTIQCLVYNHEPYLRQCLDGFVMQKTNFKFEAIVHDDCSTDSSVTIIKEYAEKYPDIIKPIYETENQYSKQDDSLQRIMNAHTHGKYVAFCEGDDYWIDSYKLQHQFDAMENHPECTIAYNRVNAVTTTGDKIKFTIPYKNHLRSKTVVNLGDLMDEEYYGGHWTFHTSSFFIRKEFVFKYTELSKSLFANFPYGDMPLQLTCLLHGNGLLIQKTMGCYRTLSGGYNSMLKAHPEVALAHRKQLILAYNSLDRYTQYKYHRQIKRQILRQEYKIDEIKNMGIGWFRLYPRYWELLGCGTIKGFIKDILRFLFGRYVKK